MKPTTLVYPIDADNRILMGRKKRGFGVGKYNGFGGKIDRNETFRQCAVRELYEEAGLVATPEDLECIGLFDFRFPGDESLTHIGYIYVVRVFTGIVEETDEMEPHWIPLDSIPYEHMWQGDWQWLPRLLQGARLVGPIVFNEDNETVDMMKLVSVESVLESEFIARIDGYILEVVQE